MLEEDSSFMNQFTHAKVRMADTLFEEMLSIADDDKDDVIKDKFTKEGQERFKSLYAPPRKIAKKLSARLSF